MKVPKVTDGELNVLNVLWSQGTIKASEIVKILKEEKGWNRNTTYTFINRLVDKKIVKREEPNFVCSPLYTREEISISETKDFIEKIYKGSIKNLFSAFLRNDEMKAEEIDMLEEMIRKHKEGK